MEQLWRWESKIDWLKWEIKNPKEVADALNWVWIRKLIIKYEIWNEDTLWKIGKTLWKTTEELAI